MSERNEGRTNVQHFENIPRLLLEGASEKRIQREPFQGSFGLLVE